MNKRQSKGALAATLLRGVARGMRFHFPGSHFSPNGKWERPEWIQKEFYDPNRSHLRGLRNRGPHGHERENARRLRRAGVRVIHDSS